MNATASDTTGFKRGEFQIWIVREKPGPAAVPALIKGSIGVHRNIIRCQAGEPPEFGGWWAVSHVDSGMRFLAFTSLNAAKMFASHVPGLAIPGLDGLKTGQKPEWSKKDHQKLREAVRGLAAVCVNKYGGTFS